MANPTDTCNLPSIGFYEAKIKAADMESLLSYLRVLEKMLKIRDSEIVDAISSKVDS